MAKIVTNRNGVSTSTAVPKNKTTTKSGTTGVSVGEINGTKKQNAGAIATGEPEFDRYATAAENAANAIPQKTSTKPNYQSVNGKIVDVNKKTTGTTPTVWAADPNNVKKGESIQVVDDTINTDGGLYDQKGNVNASYIPKTLEEVNNIADPYTRNALMANYYKSKGLDFNVGAKTQDEAAELFINDQKEEMSALDKEINAAKEKAQSQLKSFTGALKNQFSQSREGQQSEGNAMVAKDTAGAMSKEMGLQFDRLDGQKRQLAKLQQQQQEEYLETRATQIGQMQKDIADSETAFAESQSKMRDDSLAIIKEMNVSGALAGLDQSQVDALQESLQGLPANVVSYFTNAANQKNATEGSKAKWEKMNTALNTFKGLAAEGIEITPQMMLETAQQTGMPLEALMSFNTAAASVMQDKSLDATKQMAEIQKLGLELDRQARGVTNAELEKVDYLENLYRSGASNEEIQRFKRLTGMKDEDDPMYRLDMEKKALDNQMQSILNKYIEPEKMQELTKGSLDITGKEFDNIIAEAKANGASETEILNLRKLQIETQLKDQELIDKVGTEVITSPSSKYTMSVDETNGSLKINAKAGAWGGQCGAFVNDVFGERIVGDLFTQKMSLTDPSIKNPSPGMAFVMPTSTKYGHIGIVLKDNGNGTVNIVDSNWDNKEHIQYRTVSKSKISGYIPPPLGQSQHVAPKKNSEYDKDQQTVINQLNNQYNDISKEIRALDQGNAFLSNYSVENAKSPDDIALIYAFNKVMDPRSVVREGEFQIASSVGGLLQQFGANVEKIKGGGSLLPEQRQQIVDTMKRTYASKRAEYDPILENAIQAGGKRGIKDPTLYLDYMPDKAKTKQFNLFDPSTYDFRTQVVEDNHEATGQYSLPEDHSAVEYTF